jgi:succinoglycan biosynthesis transport protein ExoP
MQSGTIDFRQYFFILRKHWVISVAIFLVVVAAGIAYCIFWPKVYSATATVVVQPQKVPGTIVAPTVTSRIDDRLQIITQQVLSRSRLTELIERFDLYRAEKEKVAPDVLAESMRNAITIKITRKNYFTITYIYRNAKDVAQVTNALASFYVDSNLRIREQDAVGTSRFLKRELDRMREKLEEQEARLTEFKQKHLHELPEAQEKNLALISGFRGQYNILEYQITGERNRINSLETQIAALTSRIQRMELEKAWVFRGRHSPAGGTTDSESEPAAIKTEIERLKVFYKDTHPDLQRLRRHLAKAELNKKLIEEAKKKEKLAQEAAAAEDKSEQEAAAAKEAADIEIELGRLQDSRRRSAERVKEAKQRILA